MPVSKTSTRTIKHSVREKKIGVALTGIAYLTAIVGSGAWTIFARDALRSLDTAELVTGLAYLLIGAFASGALYLKWNFGKAFKLKLKFRIPLVLVTFTSPFLAGLLIGDIEVALVALFLWVLMGIVFGFLTGVLSVLILFAFGMVLMLIVKLVQAQFTTRPTTFQRIWMILFLLSMVGLLCIFIGCIGFASYESPYDRDVTTLFTLMEIREGVVITNQPLFDVTSIFYTIGWLLLWPAPIFRAVYLAVNGYKK